MAYPTTKVKWTLLKDIWDNTYPMRQCRLTHYNILDVIMCVKLLKSKKNVLKNCFNCSLMLILEVQ